MSVLGVLSILLLGFICYIFLFRLISKKPAIIINEKNIINNMSGFGEVQIPWAIVDEFLLGDASGQLFVLIKINHPHAFVNNQSGIINRISMKLNQKFYHVPIVINVSTLQYTAEELYAILSTAFEKYKDVNNSISKY